MNTTVKSLAITLGLCIATTSLKAQDFVSATVIDNPSYIAKMITTSNSTDMRVLIANPEGKVLIFTLKDAQGNAIYKKTIYKNEPQAAMKLKMDDLAAGVYTVEFGDKNSHETKSFRKGSEVLATRLAETLVAINN
jgi:hypothetical protein